MGTRLQSLDIPYSAKFVVLEWNLIRIRIQVLMSGLRMNFLRPVYLYVLQVAGYEGEIVDELHFSLALLTHKIAAVVKTSMGVPRLRTIISIIIIIAKETISTVIGVNS